MDSCGAERARFFVSVRGLPWCAYLADKPAEYSNTCDRGDGVSRPAEVVIQAEDRGEDSHRCEEAKCAEVNDAWVACPALCCPGALEFMVEIWEPIDQLVGDGASEALPFVEAEESAAEGDGGTVSTVSSSDLDGHGMESHRFNFVPEEHSSATKSRLPGDVVLIDGPCATSAE